MSDPRFKPRHYTTEPENFGRTEWIGWVGADDEPGKVRSTDEWVRIATAKRQHQCAVAIRTMAVEQFGSLKAYARECDMPYDRFSKVMRGVAIMRLEDIAQAECVLGEILTVGSTLNLNGGEMAPPTRRIEQPEATPRQER